MITREKWDRFWNSTWGLWAFLGLLLLVAVSLAWGFGCGMQYERNHPPEQTSGQYVDKQGDVTRLCLVYRTGNHVDALSCDLVDDITGEAR